MAEVFKLDATEVDSLEKIMDEYEIEGIKIINDVLHDEGAKVIQNKIRALIPSSVQTVEEEENASKDSAAVQTD